jgi:hypothetical protein
MGFVGQTITTDISPINAAAIHCYPNPTTGKITIGGLVASSKCELSVLNLSGQVLKTTTAYASETGECQLNFNDLSDQLLLIQVNQGGKMFTEKVNLTHN